MLYPFIARNYDTLDRATAFDQVNIIIALEIYFEVFDQLVQVIITKPSAINIS